MFGIFNRIQMRIFAFFVILLIAVQAISFSITFYANKRLEQEQLRNQLSVAELVFKSEYNDRNYYLSAFAETAAKDFGLKDIFIDDDSRSFLVALNNHRKRINADIAIAINIEGNIIGELMLSPRGMDKGKVKVGPEHGKQFRYPLDTEFQDVNPLYPLDDNIYQIKFAPLTSGASNIIGWVGFGYIIGDELARSLQMKTGLNAGFMVSNGENNQFISLSAERVNTDDYQAVSEFIQNGQSNDEYVLWHEALGEVNNKQLHAFMYLTRYDVLESFQKQWLLQLGLIVLMLPISLLLAFIISSDVTRPIKVLIEQARFIAKGNYNSKVQVGNSIEMKQLAEEFTVMQEAIVSRESKIAFQAYHDPLTNLPNKNELERVTQPWFEDKSAVAICLINIKRMTEVNGTLGHVVGDEVIKEVSKRLCSVDNIDLVCRMSGDEFVLVVKQTSPKALRELMAQVQQTIEAEYCYQDISLHLQLTVGISFVHYPSDLETLLRQADTSLQYAKKNKLDQQIYNQKIDVNTLERLQLINELKSAIEQGELVLFYQPKLDLKLNKVTHVEALVRWQHPDRGMIPPDTFIPIAEQMGQMNALTRWVMNESIAQYLRWKSQGIDLGIAINISAENLKDPYFCQYVLDVISDSNVPIEALTLEITEDAVVSDPENAIKQLKILKKYGLKLSIDDYGTGYSSLAQLKQLPVDELKIDKSFVQNLMVSQDDQIIVNSTLQLAHSLGLRVVAEGIEDEAALAWLTERGCEMGQGYYLSRPTDADNLVQWLTSSRYA
ncbi:EAL domain-containing protein [Shewanella eurypsychrophilus]|uniref:EAL domain-containing protein n=1 Tax=Shewanella eurypsychrophilus TaxID=2593656 RepID=A0ABX6V4B7_9GAMM|nr:MULTISPECIES: GGDEF domain-containing phosphodiesterase [Shewanella]QFU22210.1 EAL domain-containing protein [Shewanella sp. YLB-09]QPG57496.1 EAL domain-containing protein [Shewanella eurypsychrophilus]